MHSMYLAGVPSPWSMLRQPIHFAPGAIPIWLPRRRRRSRCQWCGVPWKKSSQGYGESLPQDADAVMDGVVPVVIVIGVTVRPSRGSEV